MSVVTDAPRLLSVREAAQLLRIGRNTAYSLIRQHQIPHVRLGKRILISEAALIAWLERQSGESTENGVAGLSPQQRR